MATRAIYIVDDDDSVRDSLRALLAIHSNLLIHCYRSGSAFLEQVDELDPGVLLVDYHMPGVSGVEVLRATDRSRFLTIMLTGHASVSLAMEAMRAGAIDFLEKPYEPERLLDIVDAAFERLERNRAADARVAAAQAKIERLSGREKAVLDGLIRGRPNKVIAHELEISPRTVEIHRSKLMDKLEVGSLSEALRISFAAGLIPIE
ncbi:response regulator transcription factor [Novosphingobium sp. M1R2S20]|uniref:Response regulator transcription factor n=1 Tax=Novosphingobium rhizovicinum TaxID=3228928 RepID=A0ABV3R8R2_9SPHN